MTSPAYCALDSFYEALVQTGYVSAEEVSRHLDAAVVAGLPRVAIAPD